MRRGTRGGVLRWIGILGVAVALACSGASRTDSPDGAVNDDSGVDGSPGDGDTDDAADAAGDGDTEPDSAVPPHSGAREVAATTAVKLCPGCVDVAWCRLPPASESLTLTVDGAPNVTTGVLFAAERWERTGRALGADECRILTGTDLDEVLVPPRGTDVLDAGTLSFSGDMPALERPMELRFFRPTKNYSSAARPVEPTDYAAGTSLRLDASGGADVSPFSVEGLALDRLELLSPHTDVHGQVTNISFDEPLEILWSGGDGLDDVVIIIEAYFCPWSVTHFIVCHPVNDGAFVVPPSLVDQLESPDVVELHISRSIKVPLPVPELGDEPGWSIRTEVATPIYIL